VDVPPRPRLENGGSGGLQERAGGGEELQERGGAGPVDAGRLCSTLLTQLLPEGRLDPPEQDHLPSGYVREKK
jgi:hypothetical protein